MRLSTTAVLPALVLTAVPALASWNMALSKGSFGNADIGQAAFDAQMEKGSVVKRECVGCDADHTEMIYVRLTDIPAGVSLYDTFKNNWFSHGNVLNVDFYMYGSEADFLADTNRFQFCNYDDPGVGWARDCGKTGGVSWQWSSFVRGGGKDDVAFYIYEGGYEFLGCFRDVYTDRLFTGTEGGYSSNMMTNEECCDYCAGLGTQFCATENGGSCLCGSRDDYARWGESDQCTYPCAGDASETCGGPWAMQIYDTGVQDDFLDYLGCWRDGSPYAFDGPHQQLAANSVDECCAWCQSMWYPYCGLEQGTACFCGYTYNNNGAYTEEHQSQCNTPCPGKQHESCGGWDELDVYEIDLSVTQQAWAFARAHSTHIGGASVLAGVALLGWQMRCGRKREEEGDQAVRGSYQSLTDTAPLLQS